jgi:hypothetical protein
MYNTHRQNYACSPYYRYIDYEIKKEIISHYAKKLFISIFCIINSKVLSSYSKKSYFETRQHEKQPTYLTYKLINKIYITLFLEKKRMICLQLAKVKSFIYF